MWPQGSFQCSRSSLIGLNVCYILISFLLIGVATYGQNSAVIDSLPILGGIVASGVFLLAVSIIGLIGTVRHHQVMLFFYMIILFGIFLIQFSVACAALAVTEDQELEFAHKGWNASSPELKFEAEQFFQCCGFEIANEGVRCSEIAACGESLTCPTCQGLLKGRINKAFNSAGGIGLFFSFTELLGAYLAWQYRDQVNPNLQSSLYQGNM
ncbi:hypothetical protein TCAL_06848 [Tigriopus californicus]|uniref:Tetraspanin n=2 Tax=Tigriopus californicus TaxID=6832 RepID=A0A553NSS9_TIGCA|nr:tetraspanin-31-A-like [Tigriopus californicus]TRY68470.1 hypothetical protein TCAL_06848 [Tigriopus californicus]